VTKNQTLNWEQTLFTVILHAGNARSKALEAAEMAQARDFQAAEAALAEAEIEQTEAHKVEAQIVQMEAGGEQVPFSVLLIHSMDLLLLSWAEIDHTRQMISMCRSIADLESKVSKWQK
jgi:PTS system cellobiose-specific IIA component